MKRAAFNNGGLYGMLGGVRQRRRGARAYRSRRRANSAQAMLETALVMPILLALVFGAVDGGLVLYTYNSIVNSSRAAARILTLPPQVDSDCVAILDAMQSAGNGIALNIDPNSSSNATGATGPQEQLPGNPDPDHVGSGGGGPQSPADASGFLYLWPSMSYYDSSTTSLTPVPANQPGSYPSGFRCDQKGTVLANFAQGTASPADSTGHPHYYRRSGSVKARVAYSYHPLTPLFSRLLPTITLVSESVVNTEY